MLRECRMSIPHLISARPSFTLLNDSLELLAATNLLISVSAEIEFVTTSELGDGN